MINKDEIKNGIDEIRKISMTPDEKRKVFENILISVNKQKPIKSPWSFYSFVSITNSRTILAYYIIVPLIIILSSGGAVFASENSLPDSIFYPLKVNVVEPIEGALKFKSKDKVKYESSLASKRLVEAETLAKQGRLDYEKEEKINNLLTKHTKALDKVLNEKEPSESDEEIDKVVTNFRAEMNVHARVLENITNKERNPEIKNNEVKKVKISENARVSAFQMKEVQKKKESKDSDEFIKRKEAVRALIVEADQDLDKVLSEESESKKHEYETSKVIDEAKMYLEESDQKEREGDDEEAYSSLLDSESSVVEASILLKSGFKIDEFKKDKENEEEFIDDENRQENRD